MPHFNYMVSISKSMRDQMSLAEIRELYSAIRDYVWEYPGVLASESDEPSFFHEWHNKDDDSHWFGSDMIDMYEFVLNYITGLGFDNDGTRSK